MGVNSAPYEKALCRNRDGYGRSLFLWPQAVLSNIARKEETEVLQRDSVWEESSSQNEILILLLILFAQLHQHPISCLWVEKHNHFIIGPGLRFLGKHFKPL